MDVTLTISDLAAQMFRDDQAKIVECIEREALRLWYIERSKPKPKPTSPGRPLLTPDERHFRELAITLQTIYLKLREQLGAEFESVHGENNARMEAAIAGHDVKVLEDFMNTKPWIRRWK